MNFLKIAFACEVQEGMLLIYITLSTDLTGFFRVKYVNQSSQIGL